MAEFDEARMNMVDCQLRTNCVTDPALIDAFIKTPRELFVAEGQESLAYADRCLTAGPDRVLMPPMFLGRVLQEAAVAASDLAFVVGCGTGYSCAVISHLAATTVGLDNDSEFVRQANNLFSELDLDNAAAVEGDLAAGLPKQGPYEVILVEGGVCDVPGPLFDQLSPGGRLIAFELPENGVGQAVLYLKTASGISRRVMFDAVLPVLPGFECKTGFVF